MSVSTGCGGMRSPAVNKSSKITALSIQDSDTDSEPSAQAEPLAKYERPPIVQIQSLPIVDELKSQVMPAAAAAATFTIFIKSESDAVSSSSELSDWLSPSLSLASAPEPSWLGHTMTSIEPEFIDESTSTTS
jgi:hypothetical protein